MGNVVILKNAFVFFCQELQSNLFGVGFAVELRDGVNYTKISPGRRETNSEYEIKIENMIVDESFYCLNSKFTKIL
jgi:hypothetical protein